MSLSNLFRFAALTVSVAVLAALVLSRAGVPPQFWNHDLETIRVADREFRVVLARNPAQGLAGVDDLGSLDGMLFDLRVPVEPRETGFWMLGARFALDIAFFDPAGVLIEVQTMRPCTAAAGCIVHYASRPYRWALEAPAGRLQDLPDGSRLGRSGGREPSYPVNPAPTPAIAAWR